MRCTSVLVRIFQSTLSVRRATAPSTIADHWPIISIHALREESDIRRHTRPVRGRDFNPRSP